MAPFLVLLLNNKNNCFKTKRRKKIGKSTIIKIAIEMEIKTGSDDNHMMWGLLHNFNINTTVIFSFVYVFQCKIPNNVLVKRSGLLQEEICRKIL